MKNKSIGAKVLIKNLDYKINPKDKWITKKKVPATIISKEGLEHYWTTCAGGYTYVTKHIIEKDCFPTVGVQLNNGLVDVHGNNKFIVRESDIQFLEDLPKVERLVSEAVYLKALKTIENYNKQNKL